MSCVEDNRGDQMRNRPKRLVESEFINKSTLKASSPNRKLLISDCKRDETSPPFGSLRVSLVFKSLAISVSVYDLPHKNSVVEDELVIVSMAEKPKKKKKVIN